MDASHTAAETALLEARDARIAVDDIIVVERFTCAARGPRVLCAGDVQPLFGALTGVPLRAAAAPATPAAGRAPEARGPLLDPDEPPGEARVVSGTLALAGRDVARGAHRPIAGAAPLDPPLPPRWTAEAYVAWSARLGGASAHDARDLAAAALTRIGLASSRLRPALSLALPERRALVLAAAIALSPEVVLIEDPLSGIDGAGAALVLRAIAAATEGRAAVLSSARFDLDGPQAVLTRGATHVLVLTAGDLAFEGALGDLAEGSRVYALSVRSNAEPLRAELEALGISLRGGPVRFSATLPPGATARDVVQAAARARAAMVELLPVV